MKESRKSDDEKRFKAKQLNDLLENFKVLKDKWQENQRKKSKKTDQELKKDK